MSRTRILVRAHKDPFTPVSAEETFLENRIGDNVGNLVFSAASQRILSRDDAEIETTATFAGRRAALHANLRADHLVLPLANAFRPAYRERLDVLTRYVRRLRIPVTVLGVGAQGRLGGDVSKLDPMAESVQAFVGAVLDRSPSIGVRGEFTAEYLADLGFGDEHVKVIGCPSLFLRGSELVVREPERALTSDSRIAINVSPYVGRMGPVVEANAEHYPHLVYFAQDIHTLGLMLGAPYGGSGKNPQNPITPDHVLYREGRMRFCLDPWTWFDELATYEFSFGSRIHGNISALLAGTPAVVLAHDSRTLELAEYHEIPHRRIGAMKKGSDAADVCANADWGPLQRGHQARWETFAGFLHAHGLRHGFEPGGAAEAFDARVANVEFPPPVHPVPYSDRDESRWARPERSLDR